MDVTLEVIITDLSDGTDPSRLENDFYDVLRDRLDDLDLSTATVDINTVKVVP